MTKEELLQNLMDQDLSGAEWTKSSFSGGGGSGDCVEVAVLAGGRAIRDSKNKSGGALRLTEDRMTAFLQGVKAGAFDL
ncbi:MULTISPECIES: DUF397 domain-containing protein [unclassified Streptomyces]|uniref:DUF397 domain-containing protein n=1 Tax=unclassified Streptomyces TaxID=2593676 RepID=UPI0033B522F9